MKKKVLFICALLLILNLTACTTKKQGNESLNNIVAPVSTYEDNEILDISLEIQSPFFDSKLVIVSGSGSVRYSEKESRGKWKAIKSKKFSNDQLSGIIDTMSKNKFLELKDKPMQLDSLTDGSHFTISVKMVDKNSDPFTSDAFVHSVKCYDADIETECDKEFLEIKDKIIEHWGEELKEVGI
jgi:hypothetical protein